jgi:hypothetical protein
MKNLDCPARFKTRRECWRKCPIIELYRHGEPVKALKATREMACPQSGIDEARRISKA